MENVVFGYGGGYWGYMRGFAFSLVQSMLCLSVCAMVWTPRLFLPCTFLCVLVFLFCLNLGRYSRVLLICTITQYLNK